MISNTGTGARKKTHAIELLLCPYIVSLHSQKYPQSLCEWGNRGSEKRVTEAGSPSIQSSVLVLSFNVTRCMEPLLSGPSGLYTRCSPHLGHFSALMNLLILPSPAHGSSCPGKCPVRCLAVPPSPAPPPALRCICCPVCHPHKTLSLQHLPPSWQSVLRTGACRTRLKAWPKCHLLQDALLGPDQREAFLSTRNSIGPPLNNPTPLGSALLRRISSCLLACLLPVLPKKTSGPGPEQSLVHARYSRKKTVPRAQQGCRGAGRALRLAGAVRTDLASHLSPPQTFELEGPGCPPNLTLM